MVQCAHFAFDDEELTSYWKDAGGYWPLAEEEEPEDALTDLDDFSGDQFLPGELELPHLMIDPEWKPSVQEADRKPVPCWPTDPPGYAKPASEDSITI